MSSSDWGRNGEIGLGALLLIIFALLALGVADSHYRDKQAEYAANNQDIEQGVHQLSTPRSGLRTFADGIVSNPEPQSSQEHERRNLAAQESMSVWAFWTAIFAGLTAVVAAVGLCFIRSTLKATRAATEATRHILEAELTPFLTLTPVDAARMRWKKQTGDVGVINERAKIIGPAFCSVVSNGKSTAILTAICRRWTVEDHSKAPTPVDPADWREHTETRDRKIADIPIGEGGIIFDARAHGQFLPTKGRWLIFHGYIEYADMVRDKHYVSGFAYVIYPGLDEARGIVTAMFQDTANRDFWYTRELNEKEVSDRA